MRTTISLTLALCAAAAAAAGCAPSQRDAAAGKVVGRVVEVPGDRPLDGVRVSLVYAKSEGAGAVSDREGNFAIDKGPADPDPLAIRAEKDGYVKGYKALGGAGAPGVAAADPLGPHVLRLLRADPRSLIAGLKHPDVEVRCAAARELGRLPWREAVEALRDSLKDDSGLVRFAAKEALGQIERPAP